MKRIIFIFSCLLTIAMFGCNKNMNTATELSKPDLLLQQVKKDPQFLEYLTTINSTMKIIQANATNGKASDSLLLKDKSKSVEQKFEALKYTGLDSINNNIEKSKILFNSISKKYPLILNLSKEESKLFFKKANAYFFGIKTK